MCLHYQHQTHSATQSILFIYLFMQMVYPKMQSETVCIHNVHIYI